jgi:hypothetical protein
MPEPLPPNMDIEHLLRLQSFLQDRAEAHDRAEGGITHWHVACAANLERDAGAVALLGGDGDLAATLFDKAGRRFLDLGLLVGLSLLELSHIGEQWNWKTEYRSMARWIRRALTHELQHPEESLDQRSRTAPEPFLAESISTPTQLLYLYQTLISRHDMEGNLYRSVRELLLQVPELRVGPTEIPLARYVSLLDELGHMTHDDARLSSRSRDTLQAAVLRRNEQLEAAQADRVHWNILPNPGNLIDLDLICLCAIAIDRTGSTSIFNELVEDRDATVSKRWSRLSEQIFRVDKWSLCPG